MKTNAYKVATFVLIVIIGLAGFSSLKPNQATNTDHNDPHKITSNDSSYHSQYPDETSSENIPLDSYVTRLSKRNTRLAVQAGIFDKETVFAVAYDKYGKKRIIINSDIEYKPGARHKASLITRAGSFAVTAFEGSHCLLWSDGSTGSSGGSAHAGAFCVRRGLH